MDYTCSIELPLPSGNAAQMLFKVLSVDCELQPEKVRRKYVVSKNVFRAEFAASEARLLRATLSSFYDMAIVVVRSFSEFAEGC